ncbi:MAG: LacI family DNA-binding transcriptional regulator [Firmicutes bacterium]|nr:LacI family DNA-binding transcriptional regulator [Bacillota bacterium]
MKSKDLAKLLGVSQATISLVLNGKPGISKPLREKLTNQIIELGYESMLAGHENTQAETEQIPAGRKNRGSIIYLSYRSKQEDWNDIYSFYAGVLEGAQQESREIGCNLVIMYRNCESDLTGAIKDTGNVIGLIVVCTAVTDEVLNELNSLKLPYVFIDTFDPTHPVNAVNVDNLQSFHMSVGYLKAKGHRRIGYVQCEAESSSGEDRRVAFRRALKEHHLADRKENYFNPGFSSSPMDTSGLEEQFRQAENLPTALLAENDQNAMRAVNALKRIGKRVPEDVSVIGFDDNPLSRICDPPLTTIRSSRHRIGRECVALIMRLKRLYRTDTTQVPMKISISTELVERESVRDLTKSSEEEE